MIRMRIIYRLPSRPYHVYSHFILRVLIRVKNKER
jgi:hypothetical protein